jgi:hypothetical protein
MRSPHAVTKTDQALEDRMRAFAGDAERVEVLARARSFKASWIELAEALATVCDNKSWARWGFDSFESYCRKELHVTPSTATKLLGSFRFLRTSEPEMIERAKVRPPTAPLPSLRTVDFVAKAAERGAADASTMKEIRKAAFEEGLERPTLTRRFGSVAFPVSSEEKSERVRRQLVGAARRLASLIADADGVLEHAVAARVEAAVGALLESLEAS